VTRKSVLYVVECRFGDHPTWCVMLRKVSAIRLRAWDMAAEMRQTTASLWKYRVARYVREEKPPGKKRGGSELSPRIKPGRMISTYDLIDRRSAGTLEAVEASPF